VDASVDMIDLKGQTLRRLVESMIAPFAGWVTELITDNAANRYKVAGKKGPVGTASNYYQGVDSDNIDVWRTKAGEKVWDRIVWLAQQIGCIAWMTATGQLVVGRPLYNQQPSERFYVHIDDDGNITDSNCLIRHGGPDISDRFASYAVVGQGGAAASVRGRSIADHHAEAVDLAPAFWINDGGAYQNRIPLTDVSTVKRIGNAKLITRVARRKMEGNAVDSYDMVIDAPGHRNAAGGLRAVDTVVDVDWQPRRTLGPHYVRRRTFYNDGENGERTSLAVIPSEIWLGANTDNVSDAFYNLAMSVLWEQYGL
jgi:prophage tail gpP-like protein